MQETSLQSLRPPDMSLNDFLSALFQALDRVGLRPCILRNYEGFPDMNLGNDIDFFIRASELPRAMRALGSIEGIRIVGYSERRYVAILFLEGVSPAPEIRMLHIDYNLSLTWKGLTYLPADAVVQAAIRRRAGTLNFFVPSPVHEAIISLFASLLVGAWLKEKYFPKIQSAFAANKIQAIAALRPQFSLKVATRLVDSVIEGDRHKILSCVRPLRVSLAVRSLLHRPVGSVLAVVRHYTREFSIRFSPRTLETVCILGMDTDGKTAVIESLMPMLQSAAVRVENPPSGWRLPTRPELIENALGEQSSTQAAGGWLASMAAVFVGFMEDWIGQFTGRTNLTLRITGSCIADLVIDPTKYLYGGSMGFARLASKLSPSPDLWILLDPAAKESESAGSTGRSAESAGRLEAYRAFVKTQKNYVVLDASRPVSNVTEDAYAAIIETFSKRVDRKLKDLFQFPPSPRP